MRGVKVARINLSAVALGWIVAVAAGVLIAPAVRFLYGLVVELAAGRGEITSAAAAISVLSGFVAYLIGGYAAGRLSGGSGGLNGALTAVFGVIFGVIAAAILSAFGLVFSGGVALPPSAFGVYGAALIVGFFLFLVNLFGGYVGGKVGEPAVFAGDSSGGEKRGG